MKVTLNLSVTDFKQASKERDELRQQDYFQKIFENGLFAQAVVEDVRVKILGHITGSSDLAV